VFAPIGAKWWFGEYQNGVYDSIYQQNPNRVYYYESIKDTVFDNVNYRYISPGFFVRNEGKKIFLRIIYLDHEDPNFFVVSSESLLYDFEKVAGEIFPFNNLFNVNYDVRTSSCGYEHQPIISEVRDTTVQNLDLKVFYVTHIDSINPPLVDYTFINREVSEIWGTQDRFLILENDCSEVPNEKTYLRCYEDPRVGLLNFGNYNNCGLTVGRKPSLAFSSLKVGQQGESIILYADKKIAQVTVFNTLGQVLEIHKSFREVGTSKSFEVAESEQKTLILKIDIEGEIPQYRKIVITN
jgi:hypothetical protein